MRNKHSRKQVAILCILFLLITSSTLVKAQESRHGFFNITEIGYGKGIGRIDYGEAGSFSNEGKLGRFRTMFGHYLSPRLSLGAGIGLDGSTGSTGHRFNTMPAFVDFRAYLKDTRNSPFVFVDAGHTIKIGDMFESGEFGALGLGYKKGFSRWGSLLLSASINAHQVKDAETAVINYTTQDVYNVRNDLLLYSLSVNVGLLIK